MFQSKYICGVSIYIKQIGMYVIRSFVSSVILRMSIKNGSRSLAKLSEWIIESTQIVFYVRFEKMK